MWNPDLPPLRPRFPDRLKSWMYACAKVALIMDQKVENTRPQVTQQSKARRSRAAELLGPDGQPIRLREEG